MKRFLLLRLMGLIVVLITMTALVFLLRQIIPSDPARAAVGPNAPQSVVEAKRVELGLDQPLIVQFGRYLNRLFLHADLGQSTRTARPVGSDIVGALPASAELIVAAVFIAVVIALVLAFAELLLPRAKPIRWLLLAGASAPIFLTGLVGLFVLWFKLGLLPGNGRSSYRDAPTGPTGFLTVDALLDGRPLVAWDAVQHLLLPALTLGLPMGVAVGRALWSALLGVMRQDYVRTARSKGLGEISVVAHHALRNAAGAPLAMSGLQMGLIFANLLIVERIFAWPGIGLYTVQSLSSNDLTAVLGVALVFGAAYILVNVLVDLAQAAADPRISLS